MDATTTETTTEELEDVFPDSKRDDLIEKVNALLEDEDAWTWLDQDPDVAWMSDPEESGYAKLREILFEAGWEGCYHREGARFHYDVKMNGMSQYRGFHNSLNQNAPNADLSEIEGIAEDLERWELEAFWEDLVYDLRDNLGVSPHRNFKVYQCGRSGGYANSSDLETRYGAIAMIQLAQLLARSRAYYNSREYGEYLAGEAIEQYNEEKLSKLASPRIVRIEA